VIPVVRSLPPPICLEQEKQKPNGTYNCGDVLQRLAEDFHHKCYLCECKEPASPEIEHLRPKQGSHDLQFDWHNLFYACRHCNSSKGGQFDKILDCSSNDYKIDELIELEIDYVSNSVEVYVKPHAISSMKYSHIGLEQTTDLLQRIYNGSYTEHKKLETRYLRKAISAELVVFITALNKYFYDEAEPDEKVHMYRKICRHLRLDSAFTGFKRWIIWNNQTKYAKFLTCI